MFVCSIKFADRIFDAIEDWNLTKYANCTLQKKKSWLKLGTDFERNTKKTKIRTRFKSTFQLKSADD